MIRKAVATALIVAVASVLFAAVFSAPACAREKDLGRFGAWRATSASEGGQTVCYMTTIKTLNPPAAKRTQPYLMITHRPVEASTDVFSYGAGAMLDTKRSPKIQIGQTSFELFSVRDIAWARDGVTDHKIAKAILGASTIQLHASLTRKNGAKAVADTFDVRGAADAYHAIGRACGLSTGSPKARKKSAPKRKAPPKRAK